jgi:hypothetical protein
LLKILTEWCYPTLHVLRGKSTQLSNFNWGSGSGLAGGLGSTLAGGLGSGLAGWFTGGLPVGLLSSWIAWIARERQTIGFAIAIDFARACRIADKIQTWILDASWNRRAGRLDAHYVLLKAHFSTLARDAGA